MLSRRRFLALCGAAVPGIWLAETGLIQLPARLVFAMSGSCSFCGKHANEIFGLAGVTSRNARICNECMELCFDILSEELGTKPPFPRPTEVTVGTGDTRVGLPAEVVGSPELLGQLLRRVAAGERGDPLVEAIAAALNNSNKLTFDHIEVQPPHQPPSFQPLACSFCDKTHENVAKLIAGPTVYICDACVGDAGGLFMRYGWRPSV